MRRNSHSMEVEKKEEKKVTEKFVEVVLERHFFLYMRKPG